MIDCKHSEIDGHCSTVFQAVFPRGTDLPLRFVHVLWDLYQEIRAQPVEISGHLRFAVAND